MITVKGIVLVSCALFEVQSWFEGSVKFDLHSHVRHKHSLP